MNLVQLESPTELPLTLNEMKAQSRILSNDAEDIVLVGYLRAATDRVESILKRSLMPQKWRLKLDSFPVCQTATCRNYAGPTYGAYASEFSHPGGFCEHVAVKLPRPPIISVDAVSYTSTAGATVVMVEDTDYILDITNNPPRIAPPYGTSWPAHRNYFGSIVIDFSAGYDNAPGREVKDCMLQAIRLLAATWYEQREAIIVDGNAADLPDSLTVNRMLNRYIAWGL